jgi:alkaline phosphatase
MEDIVRKNRLFAVIILAITVLAILVACAAPTPQIVEVEKVVTVEVEKQVVVEKAVVQTVVVEKEAPTPEPQTAKYVFLFIGDGMGVAQRNAAELYLAATQGASQRPEETTLLINTFPAQGMNTTYDLSSVIPDSASTATAIGTGYKTKSGVISMDADGKTAYEIISEVAKSRGLKVGVVSSVSLDHATPAAFYAHEPSRNNYYEIGQQLVASNFDYFAGSPLKRPTGNDKANPTRSLYDVARENGFTVAVGKKEFDALKPGGGKVLAVPAEKMPGDALYYDMDDVPENELTIVDLTRKGIELLDNPKGFFLMVEAGKIDWACHANDAAASIHDTIAFDAAVAEAYRFYQAHPDETLIVVTGDHETGGMTIGFAGTAYSAFFEKIGEQKGSYEQFEAKVAAWRDAGNTKFEDTWPVIEEYFGLAVLSDSEMSDLKAKADAGDKAASAKLGMTLSALELEILQQGFENSMLGREERSSDERTYLLYGGYEPMVMKLTTILNQKAGIAWTSYSHTGVPVQTSAIGVGHEAFNGYYDQTDIYHKMMTIAGF